MKLIKITKEDIAIVNFAVLHVLDYDYFETLTGYKINDLKKVIDKIYNLYFLEDNYFCNYDEFIIGFSKKDLEVMEQFFNNIDISTTEESQVYFRDKKLDWNNTTMKFGVDLKK